VALLCACKAKEGSHAPGHDVRSWSLAEIEAELARNDQALAGEGIVVAMASPATESVPPTGPVPTEPYTQPEDGDIDDAGQATEPMPEPMPTVSPSAGYEAESRPSEELAADGPSDRRGSRRTRASSRSRRDASTRCERVCRLAEATCELETQICELAVRHPDEPRYEQACLRAEQQCVAATEACQRCED
jgi:hypothetical protein